MVLETVTRRLKRFYEEVINRSRPGQKGLDDLLFNERDVDADSAAFALDELVVTPHAISFRKDDEQSQVIPYVPGLGNNYAVPRSGAKTQISERLRDAVIAGGEAFESLSSRERRLIGQIITQHTVGHEITRWKLALDVMRTGKFSPKGLQNADIGLEIDFGRDASLSTTYDFTQVGAKMNTALGKLYDAYRAQNGSGDELVVIVGKEWLEKFETDADVTKRMEANASNILLQQNMMPNELQNTHGLYLVSRYRIPGKVSPVWICAFSPQGKYVSHAGASATDFMPTNEAVMFSLGDTRYKVLRGVDVVSGGQKIGRAVGDVVFDSFIQNDPPASVLRSQTRYAFVPANVNRTARIIGTFESES